MQTETAPHRHRFEQLGEKLAAIAIIILIAAGFFMALNSTSPLKTDWIWENFPKFFEPARLTLMITVASYAVGMAIGLFLGWVRTIRNRIVRAVATGWVEAIRGTPFFVQLLFLFYLFLFYNPGDLATPDRLLLTGFLAMMINTGAYQAEIFRAGLQSVPAGQVEAARAVGLGYWGSMRSVILPQAFRVIIPPLTNEFILMLKASALLAIIGVRELAYHAKIATFTGNLVEVYIIVTVLYLLMTIPLAKIVAWLERRFRIPGLGLQQDTRVRRRRGSESALVRVIGVAAPRRLLTPTRR